MKKIVFLIGLLVLLVSCSKGSEEAVGSIGCSAEDCKLVYDGIQYYTYNPELKSLTGKADSTANEFQYRLYNNDEYITSGNSINNEFKIMKKANEKLETIYSHRNKNEAIFPFAVAEGSYIFSVMDYSDGKQKFGGLFQLNSDNKLEKVATESNDKTDKMFGIGIGGESSIYTLLHENEKQNLYKTNLSLSKFELIAEDVSQNISTLFDKVCYIKDQNFFCGSEVIKKLEPSVELAWVLRNKYLLEVNDIGGYEVRNLKDKNLLLSGTGFIGFDENASEVIIYNDGRMERLEG